MVDTKHDTPFTFTRDERLKSRKLIEQLFRRKLFVQDPLLRIYYSTAELAADLPAQFGFSVSKKNFSKATDRNRIKRLMRESVRHLKPAFYQTLKDKNKQLILLLSYQGKELPELNELHKSIEGLFSTLTNKDERTA